MGIADALLEETEKSKQAQIEAKKKEQKAKAKAKRKEEKAESKKIDDWIATNLDKIKERLFNAAKAGQTSCSITVDAFMASKDGDIPHLVGVSYYEVVKKLRKVFSDPKLMIDFNFSSREVNMGDGCYVDDYSYWIKFKWSV